MKYTFQLVVVMALFAIQPSYAQVSNPDTMVHKIFDALKAEDAKAFVSLYPNGQQMGRFMKTVMEKVFKSEKMMQLMLQDEKAKNLNVDSLIKAQVAAFEKPETAAAMQQSFTQNFAAMIDKGKSKGVKWSEASLERYTIDTSFSEDDELAMMKETGIKNMKGVIEFKVLDSSYQLSFDKVLFIPEEGGWFGGELVQVARKGETLAPDMADAEEIPVAQPAPQTKTTGKAPAAKPKQPAKKPAKPKTKS